MSNIKYSGIRSILLKDANKLSSNAKQFCESNVYQSSLLLQLWEKLLDDVDQRNPETLNVALIPVYGLVGTIALASRVAEEFVSADMDSECESTVEATDIYGGVHSVAVCDFIRAFTHSRDPKTIMELLRFPKRFTPFHADKLEAASLAEFKQLQNRAKMRNRRDYSTNHIVMGVRARCHKLLKGYKPLFNDAWRVFNTAEFSSGNSSDAVDRSLAEKLYSWADPNMAPGCMYPNWGGFLRLEDCSNIDYTLAEFDYYWSFPYIDRTYYMPWVYGALVNAVPKSYKSARIIAQENSTRNYAMSAIRKEMLRVITKNCKTRSHQPIQLDDQSPNQLCAFQGSMDSRYATVDLSSASDTICVAIARAVLPRSVYRDIQAMRAQFVWYPSKEGYNVQRNHIWLTSGCTVTFVSMSAILVAAGDYSGELYSLFTGDKDVLPVIVYGDDCCVDSKIYSIFCAVLEVLGFMVNEAKSFSAGSRFRESCGVDYFDGQEMTTQYWPRHAIKDWNSSSRSDTVKTYATLVDLQHKYYDSLGARKLLTDEAVAALASLGVKPTFSMPLQTHNCLWSDLPSPLPGFSRSYKVIEGKDRVPGRFYTCIGSKPGQIPEALYKHDRYSNYLTRKYVEYLAFGPELADDPLMRLLGLTQSRIKPGDFGGGSPALIKIEDI